MLIQKRDAPIDITYKVHPQNIYHMSNNIHFENTKMNRLTIIKHKLIFTNCLTCLEYSSAPKMDQISESR